MSLTDKIRCDHCGRETERKDSSRNGWIRIRADCLGVEGQMGITFGVHGERLQLGFDFCTPQCFVAYVFDIPRYIILPPEQKNIGL